MSEDVLNVTLREGLGSAKTRRLRLAGNVPAVLYGHGQDTVHLSVPEADLNALIRHGGKFVKLSGASSDNALLNEIQWDALGSSVLHVDLTRVDAAEKIVVTVPVELRGDAPGANSGGTVNHAMHEIEVECAASALPERIEVRINELEVGDSISVADLELPPGVTTSVDEHELVVQCIEVVEAPEQDEAGAAATSAEPEVIGEKKDDGEGEGDS